MKTISLVPFFLIMRQGSLQLFLNLIDIFEILLKSELILKSLNIIAKFHIVYFLYISEFSCVHCPASSRAVHDSCKPCSYENLTSRKFLYISRYYALCDESIPDTKDCICSIFLKSYHELFEILPNLKDLKSRTGLFAVTNPSMHGSPVIVNNNVTKKI